MRKTLKIVLGILLISLIFTSCNKNRKIKKHSGEFIFVCSLPDNVYWIDCMKGISKADAELGTHTKIIGPKDADKWSTEIIGFMEKAIKDKPAGIMAYSGIEGMFKHINNAVDSGIPVVSIDSDAPSTKRIAFVGSDPYNMGYQAGEAMVKYTDGHAKVGVLISSILAQKEMSEVEAFRDAIMDYDIEIVAFEETDAEIDVSEFKTKKMLREHPEITAMFNTSNNNVTGAAHVKKASNPDLILIGFDDTEENVKLVREGVIDAIIVQNPEQMGYQAVYVLKETLDKGTPSKSSYKIPAILVTKENADSYKKKISYEYLSVC